MIRDNSFIYMKVKNKNPCYEKIWEQKEEKYSPTVACGDRLIISTSILNDINIKQYYNDTVIRLGRRNIKKGTGLFDLLKYVITKDKDRIFFTNIVLINLVNTDIESNTFYPAIMLSTCVIFRMYYISDHLFIASIDLHLKGEKKREYLMQKRKNF